MLHPRVRGQDERGRQHRADGDQPRCRPGGCAWAAGPSRTATARGTSTRGRTPPGPPSPAALRTRRRRIASMPTSSSRTRTPGPGPVTTPTATLISSSTPKKRVNRFCSGLPERYHAVCSIAMRKREPDRHRHEQEVIDAGRRELPPREIGAHRGRSNRNPDGARHHPNGVRNSVAGGGLISVWVFKRPTSKSRARKEGRCPRSAIRRSSSAPASTTHPTTARACWSSPRCSPASRSPTTPRRVCPVIGSVLRAYNDFVDDAARQDLYAYAARVVGSRARREVERARNERVATWSAEMRLRTLRRFLPLSIAQALSRMKAPRLDSVGTYAVRVIPRHTPETHSAALSLVDELLAIHRRAASACAVRHSRTPRATDRAGCPRTRADDARGPVGRPRSARRSPSTESAPLTRPSPRRAASTTTIAGSRSPRRCCCRWSRCSPPTRATRRPSGARSRR